MPVDGSALGEPVVDANGHGVAFPPAQRGAGIEPLIVVAMRGAPVKLTAVSATVRSNSVPVRTGALPVAVSPAHAHAGLSQGTTPAERRPRPDPEETACAADPAGQ